MLGLTPEAATTVSFLTIALAQLWHVFNMRPRRSGIWRNAVTENRYVWLALALCLGLIAGATQLPVLASALQLASPGAEGWMLALACSLVPLVAGQVWLGFSGARGTASGHDRIAVEELKRSPAATQSGRGSSPLRM